MLRLPVRWSRNHVHIPTDLLGELGEHIVDERDLDKADEMDIESWKA